MESQNFSLVQKWKNLGASYVESLTNNWVVVWWHKWCVLNWSRTQTFKQAVKHEWNLRLWFKIHKEMSLCFPFLFIPPAACTTKLLDKLFRCNCSLTVLFALVDFVPVNQSNLVKKKTWKSVGWLEVFFLSTSYIFFYYYSPCISLYSSIDYCLL